MTSYREAAGRAEDMPPAPIVHYVVLRPSGLYLCDGPSGGHPDMIQATRFDYVAHAVRAAIWIEGAVVVRVEKRRHADWTPDIHTIEHHILTPAEHRAAVEKLARDRWPDDFSNAP